MGPQKHNYKYLIYAKTPDKLLNAKFTALYLTPAVLIKEHPKGYVPLFFQHWVVAGAARCSLQCVVDGGNGGGGVGEGGRKGNWFISKLRKSKTKCVCS